MTATRGLLAIPIYRDEPFRKVLNWQIPRATIFGTADWYKSLESEKQQAVYFCHEFIKSSVSNTLPYYDTNRQRLTKPIYDWLFWQIQAKKSDIPDGIVFDIKELSEGDSEESFSFAAYIGGMYCSLKFKQGANKAHFEEHTN